MPPRDTRTLDLLTWEPPKLVTRFEETRVRATSLRSRIAKAMSVTLKEDPVQDRDVLASDRQDIHHLCRDRR